MPISAKLIASASDIYYVTNHYVNYPTATRTCQASLTLKCIGRSALRLGTPQFGVSRPA